jgi:hypothetical protein
VDFYFFSRIEREDQMDVEKISTAELLKATYSASVGGKSGVKPIALRKTDEFKAQEVRERAVPAAKSDGALVIEKLKKEPDSVSIVA